jgi:hypothetical protein
MTASLAATPQGTTDGRGNKSHSSYCLVDLENNQLITKTSIKQSTYSYLIESIRMRNPLLMRRLLHCIKDCVETVLPTEIK